MNEQRNYCVIDKLNKFVCGEGPRLSLVLHLERMEYGLLEIITVCGCLIVKTN